MGLVLEVLPRLFPWKSWKSFQGSSRRFGRPLEDRCSLLEGPAQANAEAWKGLPRPWHGASNLLPRSRGAPQYPLDTWRQDTKYDRDSSGDRRDDAPGLTGTIAEHLCCARGEDTHRAHTALQLLTRLVASSHSAAMCRSRIEIRYEA